jgi:hypothetical protein
MESLYRFSGTQVKFSLLFNENGYASLVPGGIENGVLFLLSHNHVLWNNILGEFWTWQLNFQITKESHKNYDRG